MKSSFPLSEEEVEKLENLSALGYTPEEIQLYLGITGPGDGGITFTEAAADRESNIYYHIHRGRIRAAADEQLAILQDASKGDIPASQQLGKIKRTRAWELSRLDIFGGFADKQVIEKLQDYIQSGSIASLNAEEAIYIEALTLFSSMSRKYGRRNTIRFFTGPPFHLKHARASEMYDEAVSLFYTDRNIEKKALRNKLAEQLDEAAIIVRDNAQSAKDWEVYGNLVMKSATLQELDKPDVEKLPVEVYQKSIRVYTLDTETIGLPRIDRKMLAQQIEGLQIPERDKIRLRKDALIEPFNIQETFNELEEESKSEE